MQVGLSERLKNGKSLVVAEGYLFEFERRGRLKAGAFVPEICLKRPDLVKSLYEEFVYAGSDVVLAFTYYAHREKLRVVGLENDLEKINRTALKLAREVADDTGTLMAGNICNTTVYDGNNPESFKEVRSIFKEQIQWAVEEKADFIVGETFGCLGEAMIALKAIQEFGKGLPSVITLVPRFNDVTEDDVDLVEAVKQLQEAGATVAGLNCGRGPQTMLPVLRKIKKACKGPVAALPVVYRTRQDCATFQSLTDPDTGDGAFPVELLALACGRREVAEFAQECKEIGIEYVGLCCGNASCYTRIVAEVNGRSPGASQYSPDMSQHYTYGTDPKFYKMSTAESIKQSYVGK